MDVRSHVTNLLDWVMDSTNFHCGMIASSGEQPLYERTSADSKLSEYDFLLKHCRFRGHTLTLPVPSAFNVFEPLGPELIDLFDAISQLAQFDTSSADALPRLRELTLQVFVARLPDTVPDEEMLYALHQVRNAACALCGKLRAYKEDCKV